MILEGRLENRTFSEILACDAAQIRRSPPANNKVSVYLTFYRKCFSNLVLTKNFEHMPNELISHSG